MEKGIKKLNKMSMKEVWQFYNNSFKKKSQTKITIENEEAKNDFMEFWKNLYKDSQKDNDMRILRDYMVYNY